MAKEEFWKRREDEFRMMEDERECIGPRGAAPRRMDDINPTGGCLGPLRAVSDPTLETRTHDAATRYPRRQALLLLSTRHHPGEKELEAIQKTCWTR